MADFTDEQLELLAKHARVIIAAAKQTFHHLQGVTERREAAAALEALDQWCWHSPSCANGERCVVTELNRAMREEAAIKVRFTHNVKLPGGGDADPEYVALVDLDAGDIIAVRDPDGEDAPDVAELLYTGQLPEVEHDLFQRARAERKAVSP